MIKTKNNIRKKIRIPSAILGFILLVYLLFCLLGLVPLFESQPLGMNLLHLIGQGAIVCFLVAAWGYWEI